MRQKRERHSEDIYILRFEATVRRQLVVGRTAQPTSHNLLAEKLACKRSQAHDVGHSLGVPAFGEHAHRNHVLDAFTLRTYSPDGIHLAAQQLGFLFLRQLAPRAVAHGLLPVITVEVGHRFLHGLRLGEHLRVDVQRALGVAQLVDANSAVIECVLDSRGGLGAVGDGDHYWRRRWLVALSPSRCPILGDFAPIVTEQVVAVRDQIRQRILGLGAPVEVVLYGSIVVNVVETRLVRRGVRYCVVANDHPRGLDQSGLDGVVQAEVAHDPAE